MEAAPGRVAAYGIENEPGRPIYVHAKVCIMDDVWASVGSDNFNRRSWTHDSELTAASWIARAATTAPTPALRLRLMAEHLGRLDASRTPTRPPARGDGRLRRAGGHVRGVRRERRPPWTTGTPAAGSVTRPPGRLRKQDVPDVPPRTRFWARLPLRPVHDPDGRPCRPGEGRRF